MVIVRRRTRAELMEMHSWARSGLALPFVYSLGLVAWNNQQVSQEFEVFLEQQANFGPPSIRI